jgi:hypothetical protein
MPVVKKLAVAPLFLITLFTAINQMRALYGNTNLVFSFDSQIFYTIAVAVGFTFLSCILYVTFIALSQEWKYIIPVILLSSLLPFISISTFSFIISSVLILNAIGVGLCLTAIAITTQNKLVKYIDFQPTALFSSSVKNLLMALLILFSILFYYNANQEIAQKGFHLPDSLIDFSLKLFNDTSGNSAGLICDQVTQQLDSSGLNKSQIEKALQDPKTAKQISSDPSQLEIIKDCLAGKTPTIDTTPIKQTLTHTIDNFVKPYTSYVAPTMALLFYSLLTFFSFIFSLFTSVLLFMVFKLLEKTNYIHFEKEMREVKKLVV